MKLEVRELKRALIDLRASVEKKDMSLITAQVFFREFEGGVSIITSDGETYTQKDILCDNALTFDVSFSRLKKYIDSLKCDIVQFEVMHKDVKIFTDDSNILLSMYELTEKFIDDNFTLDSDIITYDDEIIINESIFNSIDKNNKKPELNGLLVDFREGNIVSSDTRRLTVSRIPKEDIQSIIIPKQALVKNMKLSGIKYSGNTVHFKGNNLIKKSKLINGRYPDYQKIIPQSSNLDIKLNGLELKDKLKSYNEVEFAFCNNVLTVSCMDSNSKFNIKCDYPSATKITIGVNAKYIRESILENQIILSMNDNNLPFTIKNNNIDTFTVIMPIVTEVYYDFKNIIGLNDISSFKWDDQKPKPKRVNRAQVLEAKIKELELENNKLKNKLRKYESEESIVKNEIFDSILNKCTKVNVS